MILLTYSKYHDKISWSFFFILKLSDLQFSLYFYSLSVHISFFFLFFRAEHRELE